MLASGRPLCPRGGHGRASQGALRGPGSAPPASRIIAARPCLGLKLRGALRDPLLVADQSPQRRAWRSRPLHLPGGLQLAQQRKHPAVPGAGALGDRARAQSCRGFRQDALDRARIQRRWRPPGARARTPAWFPRDGCRDIFRHRRRRGDALISRGRGGARRPRRAGSRARPAASGGPRAGAGDSARATVGAPAVERGSRGLERADLSGELIQASIERLEEFRDEGHAPESTQSWGTRAPPALRLRRSGPTPPGALISEPTAVKRPSPAIETCDRAFGKTAAGAPVS